MFMLSRIELNRGGPAFYVVGQILDCWMWFESWTSNSHDFQL